MRKENNAALIVFLGIVLFIYMIVNAFRHIKVYVVFSSGLTPIIIMAVLILAIVILIVRSL
ncbi:hypothetical protein BIV60_27430 [Bacillus sp. MUM 116]|uniref:hypothetical protein n=1 Tax=Bacillus sp. MUM 116 TaxID=1678002 RepID=UPI0008F55CC0|nr:hypothetical protein [Bacillus sp. MUM 116]OIK06057.1 hypothetical protein BIV60_27430 [Bacillus sp. MUM 116]